MTGYDLEKAARLLGVTVPKLRQHMRRLEIEKRNGVQKLNNPGCVDADFRND